MTDWVKDIHEMHQKYGVHEAVDVMNNETLRKYLTFRINFLQEELDELKDNQDNPEEIVDALIDLCVVAIGTLDAFNVNGHAAWNEVHRANMQKKVGVKETRPNPLGLPDLVKPEDWVGPDHSDNHGFLKNLVE